MFDFNDLMRLINYYFKDHDNGRWQIDANPDYFEYIIKYLRTGKFNDVRPGHTLQGFLHQSFLSNHFFSLDLSDEAEALKLDGLVEICQQKILERQNQHQQFMQSVSSFDLCWIFSFQI